MSKADRPPNILIVVLDCVRASDFLGGNAQVEGMPFCATLRKEAVVFPRSVSPSPWTLPSHASLFTGLQPWESGCHWKGDLKLDPAVPRLASQLKSRGYRTLSLSANPLISPTFNLLDGFDKGAWAEWWEPYFRVGGDEAPSPDLLSRSSAGSTLLSRIRKGPIDDFFRQSTFWAHRYPFLIEAGSKCINNFGNDPADWSPTIARWIEPTLEQWVGATPQDQPTFAFVNLLDAHEPYFSDPAVLHGLHGAIQYLRARQDNIGFDAGSLHIAPSDLELLHGLYVRMIRLMDARIQRIVSVFQKSGRWDNTLMVLTSDHGQAFGEHGTLFHMIRVDEQVIRIPLWVRFPYSRFAGASASGWASLVDIAPTVLEACGSSRNERGEGANLTRLIDADRPKPISVISDGVPWSHNRGKFAPERLADLDRLRVAVYEGDTKYVVEGDGTYEAAFDVLRDPKEAVSLVRASSNELRSLKEEAGNVRARMLETKAVPLTPDVNDRLKSWGYL